MRIRAALTMASYDLKSQLSVAAVVPTPKVGTSILRLRGSRRANCAGRGGETA